MKSLEIGVCNAITIFDNGNIGRLGFSGFSKNTVCALKYLYEEPIVKPFKLTLVKKQDRKGGENNFTLKMSAVYAQGMHVFINSICC